MKAVMVRVLVSLLAVFCSVSIALAQSNLSWFENSERSGSEIRQCGLNAKTSIVVSEMTSWYPKPVEIVPVGEERLYVLFDSGNSSKELRLGRISIAAGEFELLKAYTSDDDVVDLAVDEANDWVYYHNNDDIIRSRISMAVDETLADDEYVYKLLVDFTEGKLYWLSSGDIKRAELDGSGAETILEGEVDKVIASFSHKKLFYSIRSPEVQVYEFDLQTNESTLLYTSEGFTEYPSSHVYSLAHDPINDVLYWSEVGFRVESAPGRPGYLYVPKGSIFSRTAGGEVTEELDGEDNTAYDDLSLDTQAKWLFYTDGWQREGAVRLVDGFANEWYFANETHNGLIRTSPDGKVGYAYGTGSVSVLDLEVENCCSIPEKDSYRVVEAFNGQVFQTPSGILYYTIGAQSGDALYRKDPEYYYTGGELVASNLPEINDLVFSDRHNLLFISDNTGLKAFSPEDSTMESFVDAPFGTGPLALSSDEMTLYWVKKGGEEENSPSKIWGWALDSGSAYFIEDVDVLKAFTVDIGDGPTRLFWSDGEKIMRSNSWGFGITEIYSLPGGGIYGLQADTQRKRLYVLGPDGLTRITYEGEETPGIELDGIAGTSDVALSWTEPAPSAVPYDYDADGVSDHTIYRQWPGGGGEFFSRRSSNGLEVAEIHYYTSTPIMLNYRGEGKIDYWVIGDNAVDPWVFWQYGTYAIPTLWGMKGDITVPADFDGDGLDEIAVYRPNNETDELGNVYGAWYIRLGEHSQDVPHSVESWGLAGDIPIPADYDGDGIDDVAVWRPEFGNWYIKHSGYAPGDTEQAYAVYQWGLPGDIPLAADMDNDGKAELIVWRPSNGAWYIRNTATEEAEFVQWGLPGDMPLIGDFNGDGLMDLTVYRENSVVFGPQWYTNFRNGETQVVQWGLPGDLLPQ